MSEQKSNRILPEDWNEISSNPLKVVKLVSLTAVTVVLSILNWWFINQALNGNQEIEFWIWPILATMFWIIGLGLLAIVDDHKIVYWAVNLFSFVAYVVLLPQDLWILAGGVIFFLLSIWFMSRLKSVGKDTQHFSITRIFNASMGIMIYALLVVLAFNIYYTIDQRFKANPDKYYDQLIDAAIDRAVLEYSEEEFLQELNISAVSSLATEQLKDLLRRYEQFFPLIFTVIVVALLRTFAFLFKWATLGVSWLIFQILLLTKFLSLEKEYVEVEKLNIK